MPSASTVTSSVVALEDAVVDDALHQQRRDHDQTGVDDGQRQEDRDQAAVRAGEPEDAADGPAGRSSR